MKNKSNNWLILDNKQAKQYRKAILLKESLPLTLNRGKKLSRDLL